MFDESLGKGLNSITVTEIFEQLTTDKANAVLTLLFMAICFRLVKFSLVFKHSVCVDCLMFFIVYI